MYMCVGCFDWFHSDCIKLSNDCHNHSDHRSEVIPGIPENPSDYFFLCFKCMKDFKIIPAAYSDFIYFDESIKRPRSENCPVQGKAIKDYPYHIFIEKSWMTEKCKCEDCLKFNFDQIFLSAEEIENKKGLLEIINDESEKIMNKDDVECENDDEEFDGIDKLPHEVKIELANGIQVLKEAFDEVGEMISGNHAGHDIVEQFERRLREKYEAYKKAKLVDDTY
jgi:hypothetical protein